MLRSIGFVPKVRPDPTFKNSTIGLAFAKTLLKETEQWHKPDRRVKAERHSLGLQSAKHKFTSEPVKNRDWVIDEMVSELPGAGGEPVISLAACRLEVEHLKNSSSPGYPFMRDYTNNAALVEGLGADHVASLTLERLTLLSKTSVEHLSALSAVELVQEGFRDPVRVLVKDELHSTKKMQEGRMRLICSISVLDQLVERVLCTTQNKHEISNYHDLPVRPGMGSSDVGLIITREMIAQMDQPVGTDVSGWDWCVPQWLMEWDARRRAKLANIEFEDSMFQKMAIVMGLSVFVLSDGECFEQLIAGIMLSGRFNTSSSNSNGRVMLSKCVHGPQKSKAMAMGDDCVESVRAWTPDNDDRVRDEYAKYGVTLKGIQHASTNDQVVEFCSYAFNLSTGECAPVTWHKIAATCFDKLSENEAVTVDLLLALDNDLRHSPHRIRCLEVAKLLILEIRDRANGRRGPSSKARQ